MPQSHLTGFCKKFSITVRKVFLVTGMACCFAGLKIQAYTLAAGFVCDGSLGCREPTADFVSCHDSLSRFCLDIMR